jgi:hypothetical protein
MSRTLAADEPPFPLEDTHTHTHTLRDSNGTLCNNGPPSIIPLIQLHSWRADLLLLLLQHWTLCLVTHPVDILPDAFKRMS